MATYTSQPDETTGLDSYIELNAPTTNHGADATISVGEHDTYTGAGKPHRSLIDFPSKPAVVAVSSSILTLYLEGEFSANARTLTAYLLKRNWVESQATWNIFSTGNSWETAGASGANDIGSAIGTLALSATEAVGAKNITLDNSLTKDWFNGLYYGLLLMVNTENDDYYYFPSSSGATASSRPKLVVSYTSSSVKKINGVAYASIKKVSGVAIASIKKISGVS